MYAKVESGKEKKDKEVDYKIVISELYFIGRFSNKVNLQIFNSSINIDNELKIRTFFKNWAYIENNNFNDKKKIKYNFKDTILFFSGIYLLYLREYNLSLEILKKLFNKNLSCLSDKKNGKLIIKNENIAAGRLNNILLNLFYYTAIKTYFDNNDFQTAYNLLKECESIFSNHPDSYSHYISLARFAYEIGRIEEAKSYTYKAKAKQGFTIHVLINLAFFAIVEFNVAELVNIYNKIKKINNTSNFNGADVIEFLERQKDSLKQQTVLIDFSIGTINRLFLDTEAGLKLLTEFIEDNNQKEEYRQLVLLAKEFSNNLKQPIVTQTRSLKKRKKKIVKIKTKQK
jgi:tetratricopeptide (TPR) repeat protein